MLRVRTYLDRSALHGIGLFAAEDIRTGSVVWEFSPVVDLVFEPGQWELLREQCAPESFEQLRKYSYKEGGRFYVCCDNAQFMNHSASGPNVRNAWGGGLMVASRPITKGEELLCDYREYCDPDDYNLGRCGG